MMLRTSNQADYLRKLTVLECWVLLPISFLLFFFDVGCSSANAMLGFRQEMWLLKIPEQRSVCKLFILICFSLD